MTIAILQEVWYNIKRLERSMTKEQKKNYILFIIIFMLLFITATSMGRMVYYKNTSDCAYDSMTMKEKNKCFKWYEK